MQVNAARYTRILYSSPQANQLALDSTQRRTECRPALNTFVVWRTNRHADTREYLIRHRTEGKNDHEIRRCLKCHLGRWIFKLLEGFDSPQEHPDMVIQAQTELSCRN